MKPLFSFAGKGIIFAPTDGQLHSIPGDQRREYLVQEKVSFYPVIETPFGSTQAEIRVLYLWPDAPGPEKKLELGVTNRPPESQRMNTGGMEPVLSLVRLGRGKMMGVDHNRDQKWVGASAAYFVE